MNRTNPVEIHTSPNSAQCSPWFFLLQTNHVRKKNKESILSSVPLCRRPLVHGNRPTLSLTVPTFHPASLQLFLGSFGSFPKKLSSNATRRHYPSLPTGVLYSFSHPLYNFTILHRPGIGPAFLNPPHPLYPSLKGKCPKLDKSQNNGLNLRRS